MSNMSKAYSTSNPAEERNKSSNRKGKKTHFTPLLDYDHNILIPGRHPCDCEASAHKLVNNCLSCGRIVCEQEGVGPCFTCQEMVNDRETERLFNIAAKELEKEMEFEKKKKAERNKRGGIKNIAASLETAVQHKNKLLDYDRNCEQRTKVIDDEADYFRLTSQHWLSKEKRQQLETRIDNLQEKKFAKDRKFFLDVVNRKFDEEVTPVIANVGKVVEKLEEDSEFKSDYQVVDSKSLNYGEKLPGAKYCAANSGDSKAKKETKKKTPQPKPSSTQVSLFTNNSLRLQDSDLMEISDTGVCLTVQQPWASLIISGIKLHEGRSWYTHYRGRLWIYSASKNVTADEINSAKKTFATMTDKKFPCDFPRSLLLGCVTLKDCLPQEEYTQVVTNPYMESTYVWMLEDPLPLKVKIPMTSKSNRLYQLDDHILKAASKQLEFSLSNVI